MSSSLSALAFVLVSFLYSQRTSAADRGHVSGLIALWTLVVQVDCLDDLEMQINFSIFGVTYVDDRFTLLSLLPWKFYVTSAARPLMTKLDLY